MLGNRYSQYSFSRVPDVKIQRSSFDRSFAAKDTFDFDLLVPMFVDEIVPGDDINLTMNTFARLSSQATKAPIMDNAYLDYFFFFVPNRLVWTNWVKLMGEQEDPGDSIDYTVPTITTTAVTGEAVGQIYDKMGIPTGIPGLEINALPFRCYNLIYNEWFRDQNIFNSISVPKDDGPDTPNTYVLQFSAKKHDYFTSALTAPQKGAAVSAPINANSPIIGIGKTNQNFSNVAQNVWETDATATTSYAINRVIDPSAADASFYIKGSAATGGTPQIYADNSEVGTLVSAIRQAMQVQRLLETDARSGTRYTEVILGHFNVVNPDFRLQRPEYLGGGTIKWNSHPVAQTSPTSGSNALGQLGAFGTAAEMGNKIGFSKSFTEHGYVIGLVRARADLTYQQGLSRMWTRQSRLDFYWPELQEIGDQTILNKEIYAQGSANPTQDAAVFGYAERFAEYKYYPSQIRGEFRSTFATSLDYYHFAEEFAALPSLSALFIKSNTPVARTLAVTDGPDILADYWFRYHHSRPMLTYTIGAGLGRF